MSSRDLLIWQKMPDTQTKETYTLYTLASASVSGLFCHIRRCLLTRTHTSRHGTAERFQFTRNGNGASVLLKFFFWLIFF